jgi:hypothetical protein
MRWRAYVYFWGQPGRLLLSRVWRAAQRHGRRCKECPRWHAALKSGSGTKLWTRLSQHRGSLSTGGGNSKVSIFRRIVGAALILAVQEVYSFDQAMRRVMARHGVISAGAQTPESLGPSWSLASPSLDAVCWSQERGENVVRPREARLNLWPYPTAGLCLRKPSLIACLIPSSIKVLAASGTLVPWVPSLDSWSKYSQVARASVIGRRSVSAMPNRIPWLGLELESFSTRKRVEIDSRFVKPAVAMLRTRKKGGRVGRPI